MSHLQNAVTRNLVASYAALVAEVLVALALTGYAVFRLGAETFGVWLVIYGITGYLALLDLGFSAAMLRHAAIEAGGGTLVSSRALLHRAARFLAPLTALILLLGAATGVAIPHLVPSPATAGTVLTISMLAALRSILVVILGVLGGTLRGHKRGHVVDLSAAMAALSTLAGGVAMLWAGLGLLSLVLPALVATALQVAFLWGQLKPTLPVAASTVPAAASIPRNIVVFSGLVLANMLAGRLVFQTDAIVVGAVIGAGAAAAYALTFRAAELGMLVSFRIADTGYPFLTASSKGRDKALVLSTLRITAAVAGLCASAVILLDERFVAAWVGADQFAGDWLVWIFAYLILHHAVLHAGSVALHAAGRIKGLVLVSIIEAIANIVLSLALASTYGLAGVAMATALAGLATSAWYVPLAIDRLLAISILAQGWAVARPLLGSIAATIPFVWLREIAPAGWGGLIVVGTGLALAHLAAFLYLGSSADDRATWALARSRQEAA